LWGKGRMEDRVEKGWGGGWVEGRRVLQGGGKGMSKLKSRGEGKGGGGGGGAREEARGGKGGISIIGKG